MSSIRGSSEVRHISSIPDELGSEGSGSDLNTDLTGGLRITIDNSDPENPVPLYDQIRVWLLPSISMFYRNFKRQAAVHVEILTKDKEVKAEYALYFPSGKSNNLLYSDIDYTNTANPPKPVIGGPNNNLDALIPIMGEEELRIRDMALIYAIKGYATLQSYRVLMTSGDNPGDTQVPPTGADIQEYVHGSGIYKGLWFTGDYYYNLEFLNDKGDLEQVSFEPVTDRSQNKPAEMTERQKEKLGWLLGEVPSIAV